MYVNEASGWGVPPHPLALSSETIDAEEGEATGRGLLARKEMVEGSEILRIPFGLAMTKVAAQEELGKALITEGMNEYFAIALLLIRERSLGAKAFWKPYIDVCAFHHH